MKAVRTKRCRYGGCISAAPAAGQLLCSDHSSASDSSEAVLITPHPSGGYDLISTSPLGTSHWRNNHLHREDGPAVEGDDEVYSIDGVEVDADGLENFATLVAAGVLRQDALRWCDWDPEGVLRMVAAGVQSADADRLYAQGVRDVDAIIARQGARRRRR